MKDFDLTIDKFFDSAIAFLEKRGGAAFDKKELALINQNIEHVKQIRVNPKVYHSANHDVQVAGFIMRKFNHNSIFQAFNAVLGCIRKYYDDEYNAEENLAKALKKWNYAKSDSVFKDFVYPFLPQNYFIADVKSGNTGH